MSTSVSSDNNETFTAIKNERRIIQSFGKHVQNPTAAIIALYGFDEGHKLCLLTTQAAMSLES